MKKIMMLLPVLFCVSFLLACQPANINTTKVALNDFYLPITDIEASQFYIGMSYEEVLEQLQHLKRHKDYTSESNFFFLRVTDGRSMVIELQQTHQEEYIRLTVKDIYLYDIKELADKTAFEGIDKTMTMPEIVAKVGLPIQANYRASVGGLYFPVSNGSVCYIQYYDYDDSDIKTNVGGFKGKDVLIYEE